MEANLSAAQRVKETAPRNEPVRNSQQPDSPAPSPAQRHPTGVAAATPDTVVQRQATGNRTRPNYSIQERITVLTDTVLPNIAPATVKGSGQTHSPPTPRSTLDPAQSQHRRGLQG